MELLDLHPDMCLVGPREYACIKLPEDHQILGCNFILLHKFQHDVLQEGVGGWGSHRGWGALWLQLIHYQAIFMHLPFVDLKFRRATMSPAMWSKLSLK